MGSSSSASESNDVKPAVAKKKKGKAKPIVSAAKSVATAKKSAVK